MQQVRFLGFLSGFMLGPWVTLGLVVGFSFFSDPLFLLSTSTPLLVVILVFAALVVKRRQLKEKNMVRNTAVWLLPGLLTGMLSSYILLLTRGQGLGALALALGIQLAVMLTIFFAWGRTAAASMRSKANP